MSMVELNKRHEEFLKGIYTKAEQDELDHEVLSDVVYPATQYRKTNVIVGPVEFVIYSFEDDTDFYNVLTLQ